MSDYTKGDWTTQPCPNGGRLLVRSNSDQPSLQIVPEADAHLISAAPDMYEALEAQHDAIDGLFALLISKDNTFFPSKSGKPWEAMIQGNSALKKARGEL